MQDSILYYMTDFWIIHKWLVVKLRMNCFLTMKLDSVLRTAEKKVCPNKEGWKSSKLNHPMIYLTRLCNIIEDFPTGLDIFF